MPAAHHGEVAYLSNTAMLMHGVQHLRLLDYYLITNFTNLNLLVLEKIYNYSTAFQIQSI